MERRCALDRPAADPRYSGEGILDVNKIISELRFERDQLVCAIESLERLSSSKRRSPGRATRSAIRYLKQRREEGALSPAEKYPAAG